MKVQIDKELEIPLARVALSPEGVVYEMNGELPKDVVALLIDDWVRRMRVEYGLNDVIDKRKLRKIGDGIEVELMPPNETPLFVNIFQSWDEARERYWLLGDCISVGGIIFKVVAK